MIEIKGKYNEAKIFTDVVASPSASSGWPMKKASAISEKRLWTPLQKSFWIRIIPGTTVPWNGFDITEKEKNLWDLTSTPEHLSLIHI